MRESQGVSELCMFIILLAYVLLVTGIRGLQVLILLIITEYVILGVVFWHNIHI